MGCSEPQVLYDHTLFRSVISYDLELDEQWTDPHTHNINIGDNMAADIKTSLQCLNIVFSHILELWQKLTDIQSYVCIWNPICVLWGKYFSGKINWEFILTFGF